MIAMAGVGVGGGQRGRGEGELVDDSLPFSIASALSTCDRL